MEHILPKIVMVALLVASISAPAQAEEARHSNPPIGDNAQPAPPARFAKACTLVTDDQGTSLDRNCLLAMAFDPGIYFGAAEEDESDQLQPHGLVEATFVRALRGPLWAFAISTTSCPGLLDTDARCSFDRRRPLLRAVTIKPAGEIPPGHTRFPQTAREMPPFLDATLNWREADLWTCRGAVDALLALDKVRWQAFDPVDRGAITGRPPREIVVTADADSILVRGGRVTSVHAARDEGQPGGSGAWAIRMMAVVEPCLRPTSAPLPWGASPH